MAKLKEAIVGMKCGSMLISILLYADEAGSFYFESRPHANRVCRWKKRDALPSQISPFLRVMSNRSWQQGEGKRERALRTKLTNATVNL